MVQENLEDLTKEERIVYKKLQQSNPLVGANFLDCIRKVQHWRRPSNLPVSSEAFSNVVDNEPCCTELREWEESLSSLPEHSSPEKKLLKLLQDAQNCIQKHQHST